MANPKVSIIVPVYKAEKYLKRCLDSIREQTLEELEIILVDDGSPDSCPKMCDDAAKSDMRIKVIHKENAGAGMARNAGLEIAQGEYIGFVDSDDYIDAKMYEELYTAAKKYDAELVLSGICYVGGNMFDEAGTISKKPCFEEDTLFCEEDIKSLMLGVAGALPHEKEDSRYGMSIWKNLFRRDVIKENNLKFLSERKVMTEDVLFMLDYINCIKRAVGISGAYYCYFRNENSISKTYNKERIEKCRIFFKEVENRLKVKAQKIESYKVSPAHCVRRRLCMP